MPRNRETERMLQPTTKPVTYEPPVNRLRITTLPGGSDTVTYYVCGECGIVLGNTPGMWIEQGDVLACGNCGTHIELRVDSESRNETPGT